MKYRELGNTGITVSELGLGCEGFIGKSQAETDKLFEIALNAGINVMDLYSPNPDMRYRVGSALQSVRKQFVLQSHLCTKWQNDQYAVTRNIDEVKQNLELSLKQLDTDYLDVGMIHYVDSVELWRQIVDDGIMKYAQDLKRQGVVRSVGISSHNPIIALEAVESGLIDVLMFSVNPCYDLLPGDEDVEALWASESYEKPLFNLDPSREKLYELCQSSGVGITVMKAFGGGQLLTADSPAGVAMSVAQCIAYALSRPGVASVMSGARSADDLKKTLDFENATVEEKDYARVFATFPKIKWSGNCMYCGHCAPCPKGIDIATVTKFLNLAKTQGAIPETVREHYAALTAKACDCIECGACERRCPFGVNIIENMRQARKIFKKP
ncbi:MAG: aldo/keto reductase [Clostridia bacterium]|nr:aldo/keto reductase [Clostridia bacterium]